MTVAAVSLLAVLVTLATAVLALRTAILNGRRLESRIQEVHVLVNSQLTTVVDRVAQLTAVLDGAGVPVPPDPDGGGGSQPSAPPPPSSSPAAGSC